MQQAPSLEAIVQLTTKAAEQFVEVSKAFPAFSLAYLNLCYFRLITTRSTLNYRSALPPSWLYILRLVVYPGMGIRSRTTIYPPFYRDYRNPFTKYRPLIVIPFRVSERIGYIMRDS